MRGTRISCFSPDKGSRGRFVLFIPHKHQHQHPRTEKFSAGNANDRHHTDFSTLFPITSMSFDDQVRRAVSHLHPSLESPGRMDPREEGEEGGGHGHDSASLFKGGCSPVPLLFPDRSIDRSIKRATDDALRQLRERLRGCDPRSARYARYIYDRVATVPRGATICAISISYPSKRASCAR